MGNFSEPHLVDFNMKVKNRLISAYGDRPQTVGVKEIPKKIIGVPALISKIK